MISVFPSTAYTTEELAGVGYPILDGWCKSAKLYAKQNGHQYIKLVIPHRAKGIDVSLLPKELQIIKIHDMDGNEDYYRVRKPQVDLKYTTIYAEHITYDLNNNLIEDIYIVNSDGQQAMDKISKGTQYKHPFKLRSNIETVKNLRLVRVNPMQAILGSADNTFVNRYGGEVKRQGFTISVNKRVGVDRTDVIRSGKNLIGFESSYDFDDVVTRIMPKGPNGVLLPEKYVDSPLINHYPTPFIEVIDYKVEYEGNFDELSQDEKEQVYRELRRRANADFEAGIDVPKATYKVNFVTLRNTVEYAEYEALENIGLGDLQPVYEAVYDVLIKGRVVEIIWDILQEKYESITLGSFRDGIVQSTLANQRTVAERVSEAQETANLALKSADGKTTNYYGEKEPSNPIEGDLWYKKNGQEDEMWQYQLVDGKLQWVYVTGTLHTKELKDRVAKELARVEKDLQTQSQNQDRQIADILSKATANANLANAAKQLAEQAKADLAQTRTTISQLIDNTDTIANQLERSIGNLRTDVTSQAQTILAQARAQADLTSRVATVETTANGTKSTVTELQKTLNKATGDIASVTSRTKTVEDNLSQTRTQYEAMIQTVNGHTGQIDSISRRTGTIEAGLTGVTERFEKLRFNNRNYFRGYQLNEEIAVRNYGPSAGFIQIHDKITADLVGTVGETYTISFEVISPNGDATVRAYNSNGYPSYFSFVKAFSDPVGNVWKKYSYTFTNQHNPNGSATTNYNRLEFYFNRNGCRLRNIKIEKGSFATDWCPADEDVNAEIATYKRTAEESSAELQRQIQLVDGKAIDAKNYAQQTAEGFRTRIESLETYKNAEGTRASQYFAASRDETARQVSALRTAVTDGYVAKAKYEEDARGVTQRFESLQVGGRNYIHNFGFTDSSYTLNNIVSQWRYERIADPTSRSGYHIKATCTQAGIGGFHRPFVDLRGEHWQGRTMTYAVDVKCSRAVTIAIGAEAIESGIKNQSVSTEWQRFAVTGKVKHISTWSFVFYIRNTQWQVGDVVYIRDPQLEDGTMATTPSPAPEDQQSYADTKIAEYSNTVDGRFATIQASVDSKANQVDFQAVKETAQLYERIIGSTETGIKDKVARMVMTDSLFLTEVKDKISGTATQVNQLSNSWAVRNLTSAGTILNQFNLLADGTNRIDGRLTHITGQTLIDNAVITSAMISGLDAGKITTGYLAAARIATNSIDGSKLVFDQAFVNKMTSNEAYLKQLFAKDAFITSVQAVTLSASRIVGGLLRATNGAVEFDLNRAKLTFNSSAKIEFNSSNNALVRKVGDVTGFLHFNNATAGGTYVGLGVTSHNEGVKSQNTGRFAGVRIFRSNDSVDQTEIYGDKIYLGHGFGGNAVVVTPTKLDATYELVDVINSIKALWRCWLHWNNVGWNPDDMNMRRAVINEYNAHNIG
ncbi:TPA: phage tail protein [Streptococcus suis]|nr:phage tail protein [Streptococcus suis]HEM3622649.1 phage tail protein [Streptococcus suis]HEM3715152.1 phage tail protein [Streptococcus suis]